MHAHGVDRRHFGDDLVQREVALDRQPLLQPAAVGRQLALGMIALRLGEKTASLALQDHHVVHKTWRHPEVPRRLAMPVPLLDKGDHPTA